MTPERFAETLFRDAEIYLARGIALTSPHLELTIELRPGPIEVSSKRVEIRRRGLGRWLIYRRLLVVDKDAVEQARQSIGLNAIGDAIVLASEEVEPARVGHGAVHSWIGVRQSGNKILKTESGLLTKTGDAFVSAPTLRRLQAQVEMVLDRGGAIDWSGIQPWSRWMPDEVHAMTITDVSAPKVGGMMLHGHWKIRSDWSHGVPVYFRRPFSMHVERAPDGRWITWGCEKAYSKWIEDEARKLAPSDEDMMALDCL